jgi:POT family proton-dependent oligopeptide transporter
MRALLILYLIDSAAGGLGWTQERASRLYGWFIGLNYLTPVAGGWLADRFLGTRRSLLIGGLVLTAGYAALSLGSGGFYVGLILIVLGTGFFKPNVHTMVGQLYPAGDPGRDSGFTLYYMGINLGAFFGPLVCAWLAGRYGWSYGFAGAAGGMTVGVAFYLWARRKSLGAVGLPPPAVDAASQSRATSVRLTSAERNRITAIGIITVFVVIFWLAFEQSGSSLNVFAARRIDRSVGAGLDWLAPNGQIPAPWFQSINPFFVLILAPAIAGLWQKLGERAPSTPAKMSSGLILLGLAFAIMVAGAGQSDPGALASPWLLVAFYLVYTLGELCFLPVGISFVSQAAPARLASMLMGIWLTANFVANLIGGYLAGMMQQIEQGEVLRVLGGDADFFLIFAVLCFSAGILLAILVPLIGRLVGWPSPRTERGRPRPATTP